MARAQRKLVKATMPHPDEAQPLTWAQIERDRAEYRAGKRGYSLEEMKAH